MVSSHDFIDDKRNKNIKIYINGKFYKRKDAKISVFDSSTMLGDGIWDSLRYHNNNFIFLKEHLDRLYKDAKLIDLKIHLTRKKLSEALIKTIQINKMKTDVHLRIIISRGIKSTPYQSPKVTISKPTIIIAVFVSLKKRAIKISTAPQAKLTNLEKFMSLALCNQSEMVDDASELIDELNVDIAADKTPASKRPFTPTGK